MSRSQVPEWLGVPADEDPGATPEVGAVEAREGDAVAFDAVLVGVEAEAAVQLRGARAEAPELPWGEVHAVEPGGARVGGTGGIRRHAARDQREPSGRAVRPPAQLTRSTLVVAHAGDAGPTAQPFRLVGNEAAVSTALTVRVFVTAPGVHADAILAHRSPVERVAGDALLICRARRRKRAVGRPLVEISPRATPDEHEENGGEYQEYERAHTSIEARVASTCRSRCDRGWRRERARLRAHSEWTSARLHASAGRHTSSRGSPATTRSARSAGVEDPWRGSEGMRTPHVDGQLRPKTEAHEAPAAKLALYDGQSDVPTVAQHQRVAMLPRLHGCR